MKCHCQIKITVHIEKGRVEMTVLILVIRINFKVISKSIHPSHEYWLNLILGLRFAQPNRYGWYAGHPPTSSPHIPLPSGVLVNWLNIQPHLDAAAWLPIHGVSASHRPLCHCTGNSQPRACRGHVG